MLNLARRKIALKCPRHSRRQYTQNEAARATKEPCEACHAIYQVRLASDELDAKERKAIEWIARQ